MIPDSGDGATRDLPGRQLFGDEPADALHAVPPKIASRNLAHQEVIIQRL